MSEQFSFRLMTIDGAARRGEIATPHGKVQTPAFMPVGTQGTVKGLSPEDVRGTRTEIVLGNTYHLMLRPGAERVAALGGLHKFMNWPLPILTDSGGFQVMSLSELRKVDERAVTFRSHLDGAMVELTPERAIEIQMLLGADIAMQLDECLKLPAARDDIARAMQLSLRWAERSKRAFETEARGGYALFGIVQGGDDLALRVESARELTGMDFHGYAIGGLAVGEPQEVMLRIVSETTPMLPDKRPRYLMGVGTPHDLIEAVARGIDMFDCVLPTRNGRHGMAFTRRGAINLAGETGIAELIGALDSCDLLISNDTGPAHIAAALGRPTLTIFGPTNEFETEPRAARAESIRAQGVECARCMLRDCPIDHRCMTRIAPSEVFERALKLL